MKRRRRKPYVGKLPSGWCAEFRKLRAMSDEEARAYRLAQAAAGRLAANRG